MKRTDDPGPVARPAAPLRAGGRGGPAALAFAFALWLSPLPAQAHHRSADAAAAAQGLAIPSLTHGQMAVIADHAAAILDLAGRTTQTDPVFRRLRNFAALQRTYCLWSLVPGSLADEDSPFNECTHAYLATLRALLVHMQQMSGAEAAVHALVGKIELEMLREQASLALCRYSGEDFSTAELIIPRWSAVPFHLPSLLTLAGMALILAGGLSTLALPRRRAPRAAASGKDGSAA